MRVISDGVEEGWNRGVCNFCTLATKGSEVEFEKEWGHNKRRQQSRGKLDWEYNPK